MVRRIATLLLAGAAVAGAASAQEAKFGALAVDRSNGFYYGFSYDQPSRAAAEQRAIDEGRKKGGKVSVVLVWSGSGCGAYRTVQSGQGDAYGWGVAATHQQADVIASREAAKRAPGTPTPNNAWACNSNTPAPLNVLKNEPVGEANTGEGIVLQNQRLVNSVAFAPDGRTVATMSYGDGKILIWDVRTGALVRTLEGLSSSPYDLTIAPDGRIAASDGRRVIVWSASGAKIAEQPHDRLLHDLTFSPDGSRLYAVGAQDDYGPSGGWVLWVMNGGDASVIRKVTLVEPHTHAYDGATYSPDGRFVVTTGDKPGEQIKIWDASSSGPAVRKLSVAGSLWGPTYSPDGRLIAIGAENGIMLLDGSGGMVRRFGSGVVYKVAFSPDGRRVAGAQRDGSVGVWDVATGRELARMIGHKKLAQTVAFSNDGRLLVSGGEDGTARLWDAETGQPLKAQGKPRKPTADAAPGPVAPRGPSKAEADRARAEAARAEADRRAAERAAAEADERAATDALNKEILARDAAIKARNEAAAREAAQREAAFNAAREKYERDKAANDAAVATAKAAREKYERDLKAYEEQIRALNAGKP